MLGYPEIERRFVREMASVVEARAALDASRASVQAEALRAERQADAREG